MAAYLVQYFGEKIITAQEYAAETRMPSPEDLRDRVIIKGKKLKNEGDDADGEVSEDDEAHEHKENRELSDTKQVYETKIRSLVDSVDMTADSGTSTPRQYSLRGSLQTLTMAVKQV